MSPQLEIRRRCPYCDTMLDMLIEPAHDMDTIICPVCASALGIVQISVTMDWYIDHEDRELMYEFCMNCQHYVEVSGACSRQQFKQAKYAHVGCEYMPKEEPQS